MDSCTSSDPILMAKKLDHSALERRRRKNIAELCSLLRSLLPSTRYTMKKLSVPKTLTCATQYIQELKKEIEELMHKKESMIRSNESSSIVSSVSVASKGPVEIQLITSSSDDLKKNKNKNCTLSEAIQCLEDIEDGLVLQNATSLRCFGEEKFINTLQFEVEGNQQIDAETLKDKLFSIQAS